MQPTNGSSLALVSRAPRWPLWVGLWLGVGLWREGVYPGEGTLAFGPRSALLRASGGMAGLVVRVCSLVPRWPTGVCSRAVTRSVKPIGKWALGFNLASLPSRAVGVGGVGAGLVIRVGMDPSRGLPASPCPLDYFLFIIESEFISY